MCCRLIVLLKHRAQSSDWFKTIPVLQRPSDSSPLEHLNGLVERVTFHNADTGFCVVRVKVRGQRELVTVIGHAPSIAPGEYVTSGGVWHTDREHGLQFNARFLKVTPPSTREGIEKYLGSGMIRGIGPAYAGRLVRAFGEQVFDVIEQSPDRLQQIDGIGAIRARRIVSAWADQKVIRDIMVFLHSHGVSTSRAVRIFKTYGAEAIALVSENPYRLARDIHGIGFLSADTIAQKMGIEKTAMIRARAGIGYALAEATSEGHCGLPCHLLVPMSEKLLEIPQAIIEDALKLELAEGAVVEDTVGGERCVFLAGLHSAERGIGASLTELSQGALPWPAIATEKAIAWVQAKLRIVLSDSQKAAVALALTRKVTVVTGGPGVGKTTLVNSILSILRAKHVRVCLCAPTGRAAKRLSESTGLEAKTIHRLLEVNPRHGAFSRNVERPLDCDLLVADESSMVDVPLMNALLKAVPAHAALILVGDVDQLPSVGPGQVLADVIDSAALPVVRLTEVFRQAAQSRIIVNAHRINQGLMPELQTAKGAKSDFYFVEANDPEHLAAKLVHVVKERIPKQFGLDPIRDIQVLCPMNRSLTGARSLNTLLQQALNPPGEGAVERFGWRYGVGDKVMQLENDYDKEVFNGDLGVVARINPEERELVIDYEGRGVIYGYDELDQVSLAYATTVHKAQGSEYPAVVIPITTQHYVMLKRNLIYTAVTRGKRLVVLIGQRQALAMAVKGKQTERRWSKLREWLDRTK
jgi:exodeoxyribonuclease V alpha subunit